MLLFPFCDTTNKNGFGIDPLRFPIAKFANQLTSHIWPAEAAKLAPQKRISLLLIVEGPNGIIMDATVPSLLQNKENRLWRRSPIVAHSKTVKPLTSPIRPMDPAKLSPPSSSTYVNMVNKMGL